MFRAILSAIFDSLAVKLHPEAVLEAEVVPDTTDLAITAVKSVHCELEPGDAIGVQSRHSSGLGRPAVFLGMRVAGEQLNIVVSAPAARSFAAAILNAADAIDGTKPLFADSGWDEGTQ